MAVALGMLGWRQNLPEFPGWRTALVKKRGGDLPRNPKRSCEKVRNRRAQ